MLRAPRFLSSLATLTSAVALCIGFESYAADLPIPRRSYLRPPIAAPSTPVARYNLPPIPEEILQTVEPRDQGSLPHAGPIASPSPAQAPVNAPAAQSVAPSAPPMPVQTVASLQVGSDKKQSHAAGDGHTFLSSLAELATFVLGFIAALIGLLVLPSVLRGFDSLLTVPPEGDGMDVPFARESDPSGRFDMQDFAQSELSAADIRRQTDVLRALKEGLDAELESVRAAIRRERAQADPKDTL